jgi:hypothetical protein
MFSNWMYVIAGLTLWCASCSQTSGPPKKVCYPVKGQLFVKGQPAVGALVIFHPQGNTDSNEWLDGYPRARVGSDGTFEAETYGERDGAPAGDYVLLVSWSGGGGSEESEETVTVDRLGGRYSDAATSPLKVKVESGPTELAPIRLP